MDKLFGIPDYIIIGITLVIGFFLWKQKRLKNVKWWWFIIWFLLFFLILPIVSAMFEINKVTRKYEIVDSFNLLYVYFRFPIYWMLGIFEITILAFLGKRQKGTE